MENWNCRFLPHKTFYLTKMGLAYMVRLAMWGQGIKFTTFKDFSCS